MSRTRPVGLRDRTQLDRVSAGALEGRFGPRGGIALGAVGLIGLALGLPSCSTSTITTLYTPYTGLRLSSASIFAGYTCGIGPGQIYAYEAIVRDASDASPQPSGLPVANVYACGVNGAFQNLPGSGTYDIEIDAYNLAAFPPQLDCGIIAGTNASGTCALPAAATAGTPTWTAHCMGTQETGDNALVTCQPLQANVAAADAGSDSATALLDASLEDAATDDATLGGDADGGADDAGGAETGVTGSDANDETISPDDGDVNEAGAGDTGDDDAQPTVEAGAPEAGADGGESDGDAGT